MSACPKGGEHVPEFPATIKDGWIIHYCKKCHHVMSRQPKARRVLATAALVAAGLVLAVLSAAAAVLFWAGGVS